MDTKAVFQFRQDRTDFARDNAFVVEVRGQGRHTISGGKIGRIRLAAVGTIAIKASIDDYHSGWTTVRVGDGEVVDLLIRPPGSSWVRAFKLFGSGEDYLIIDELDRTHVG